MTDTDRAVSTSAGETFSSPLEETDLHTLVCHRESVEVRQRLAAVHEWFQSHEQDFCAVLAGEQVVGLCSRGEIGFLMGHRYGFALYANRPVGDHMNKRPLLLERGMPVRAALERALTRRGEDFNDDVILVEPNGAYLGLIPVPALVRLQSALMAERFAAQEALHRQMLALSRQAGMAEIASGVLHNIGNVLNSACVSAGLISDGLRRSKAASLDKLVNLLQEHQADLAPFLSTDPKGRLVPAFLLQLAEHLRRERAEQIQETSSLASHLEHARHIVAMQQGYAKTVGLLEVVTPAALVEDALKLFTDSLSRHQIVLRKRFEEVPQILVDRHKALQILINLLRNAKQAVEASAGSVKEVAVSIALASEDHVRIAVQDNGVGIPPENLNRIFAHGFTTKRDGHGFGLHMSALAAKELGGSLQAQSEGPGRGASFMLELPIAQAAAEAMPPVLEPPSVRAAVFQTAFERRRPGGLEAAGVCPG